MAADKVPWISESALSNDGRRTILDSFLGPGATTPPHYHTLFSETFTLLEGSLTIFTSPNMDEASLESRELQIGESATIPPNLLHTFRAGDDGKTKNRVLFEPGTLGFEQLVLIMRGTQRDGIYQEFGKPTEENLMFLAVISELGDTHHVGELKNMMDKLYASKGDEIRALKKALVEKYASDEHLRRGMEDQGGSTEK